MVNFEHEVNDGVMRPPTKQRQYILQVEMLKIDGEERLFRRQAICQAVLCPKRKE